MSAVSDALDIIGALCTAEQVAKATRGLSVAEYVKAFNLGARSGDTDLEARLERYLGRAARSAGEQGAWLDGNTFFDELAEDHLLDRLESPEA